MMHWKRTDGRKRSNDSRGWGNTHPAPPSFQHQPCPHRQGFFMSSVRIVYISKLNLKSRRCRDFWPFMKNKIKAYTVDLNGRPTGELFREATKVARDTYFNLGVCQNSTLWIYHVHEQPGFLVCLPGNDDYDLATMTRPDALRVLFAEHSMNMAELGTGANKIMCLDTYHIGVPTIRSLDGKSFRTTTVYIDGKATVVPVIPEADRSRIEQVYHRDEALLNATVIFLPNMNFLRSQDDERAIRVLLDGAHNGQRFPNLKAVWVGVNLNEPGTKCIHVSDALLTRINCFVSLDEA
jgi:hypothetical protein